MNAGALLPLTVPEVRRLVLARDEPPERQAHRLAWSTFRRAHQAAARRSHRARRARRHARLAQAAPCPPADAGPCPVRPVPGTAALSEASWTQIAPLLAPARPTRGRAGSAPRPLLEGMLWVMGTGRPWREVPARFGPWHSVYTRYQRWCADGRWARLCAVLHPSAPAPAPT